MNQQMIFGQAVSLHRQGQTAAAERLYRQILAAEPGHLGALHMLAAALFHQGRPAEALRLAEDILALQPDSFDATMMRATLLAQAGRLPEARDGFARAAALRADQPEAWFQLGSVLFQLGRYLEAATAHQKALALRPAAAGWNAHGAALQQAGRAGEALGSYEKAIALEPGNAAFHANRARALQALERWEEAVAGYDKALALRPADPTAWHNRGAALFVLRRYADALASADKAIAQMPDWADAWKNRAVAAQNLGRYEDAHEAFRRALAIAPDDIEAGMGCVVILQVLQRFDEAFAMLERIAASRPDHPGLVGLRAGLLCEQGKYAQGFAEHRRQADLVWSAKPARAPADPPHKQRHDAQQDAWRAANGLAADDRYHILGGERVAGAAVNRDNAAAVAAQWQSSSPQIVVVDELLTPEALEGLRRFCLGSTIWQRPYKNGYLGAMLEHGFACPLLAQIAEELQATFPTILGNQGLIMAWGFSYDSKLGGIRIHADQAAVNFNFWLTPDEANNNPDRGGLVIWDKSAPLDWQIHTYNGDDDTVRAFLKESGARAVTVPYRANRAVIFDSDLFHETDTIDFKDGFLNRRINMTMLFGRRTFHGT